MKYSDDNQEHLEVIARYLYGEMSTEQMLEFETSIDDVPENNTLMKSIKQQQQAIDAHLGQPSPSVDTAWASLYRRLEKDNLFESKLPTKRLISSAWLRVAASLVFLFALGGLLLYTALMSGGNLISVPYTDSGALVHTLNDGSVLYIAPGSEVRVHRQFLAKNRQVSLKGQAYFDIEPNPNKPFVINTQTAKVEVLGTSFNLKAPEGFGVELLVESGLVRVSDRGDKSLSLMVTAGEWLEYDQGEFSKGLLAERTHSAMHPQRLQFKDATLGTIREALYRSYGICIEMGSSDLETRRITITLQDDAPEIIGEIMARTLNLNAHVANDTITLSN